MYRSQQADYETGDLETIPTSSEEGPLPLKVMSSSRYLDGFGLVGLSYKTADLDLRSSLSFSNESAAGFLTKLKQAGLKECVVLSTCNRSEIYFAGAGHDAIVKALAQFAGIPESGFRDHLYMLRGKDSVAHLFRVASGLDSAVLGETEILSQIKESWNRARELGMVGGKMELLLQKSLIASKRVRTQTQLSRHVTSVGSLAVKKAKNLRGGFQDSDVLLIGAGKTAERVAKDLMLLDLAEFTIVNRTLAHAVRLAGMYGGYAKPMEELDRVVADADVVFLAVSVEDPILKTEALRNRDKTLLVVDLSVPRACEEAAGELKHIKLLNLDQLASQCATNAELRLAEAPKGLRILDAELAAFADSCATREASESIQKLQKHAERVRQENLKFMSERLGALPEEHQAIFEELSARITRGIIQKPIQRLRDPILDPAERALISEAFGGVE